MQLFLKLLQKMLHLLQNCAIMHLVIKMIEKEAGKRIKYCREKAGETLEQIGALVNVHKTTVMRWENGDTGKIGLPVIEVLSNHFNVSSGWLSGKDVPMNKPIQLNTLTDHETAVITAYRNKPELQPAVDKLLDVPAEKQELKLVGRDGKVRKGKEAEDYLQEANEQAAKITDKPEDFGI